MLDTGIIAQAQRNKLSIRTLNLKCKVYKNNKCLRAIYDTHKIIMYNNKIYVPKLLHKHMLNWYHHYPNHAGVTRLAKTVQL